MASKNQVTLTFAGDESKLSQSFERVGQSARGMETEVGKSSKAVADSADSFDRAGEAADNVDTKAMGFRDTMTGVQDSMLGASQIAKGNLFEGFLTLGMGIGDLGSGFYNFLIPAMKGFSRQALTNTVQTVRQTAAMGTQRVSMLAGAAATRVMTVAQRGLNLAMRLNPIGLIITGLTLLGVGLVLAYRKSATFRAIVQGALRGVQVAFNAVRTAAVAVFNWFRVNAPKIGGFFSGVASTITAPFRAAFNGVRSAWNSTVGGRGFTVPGWVPGLSGKSFRIPFFHQGGIVPGAPGTETLAVLQAGERVTPANQVAAESNAGPTILEAHIEIGGEVVKVVRVEMRKRDRELKRDVKAA